MDAATAIKLSLRIAYNGIDKALDNVNPHQHVQAVLEHALRLFNVTDRPHAQGLFREDGTEVSTGQSVADAGLREGTLLFLRPRVQQGG